MRILLVSSSRSPWYAKGMSAAAHFAAAPYSIDAIGYNLERLGWTVAWLGRRDTANPFHLAKEFVIVHGWDDHYDRIWNELFGWPDLSGDALAAARHQALHDGARRRLPEALSFRQLRFARLALQGRTARRHEPGRCLRLHVQSGLQRQASGMPALAEADLGPAWRG